MLPHKGNEKPNSNNLQNPNLSAQTIDSFDKITHHISSLKFMTIFLARNLITFTFA